MALGKEAGEKDARSRRAAGAPAGEGDPRPMGRFEHGGYVWAHPGCTDFSANVNPLGMPATAREALVRSVDSYAAYPDPDCVALRRAIAAFEGVDAAWVLPTAGASDLMARVCRALRPARSLVTAPCYSGYEQALEQVGASVVRHALLERDGFRLTERVLDDVCGCDLVFLASPNNPTSLGVDLGLLGRVVARAAEVGATVVLDECFCDFCERPSGVALVGAWPNLVVMKALTKTFALAGLRVGYGVCSDAGLLAGLAAQGEPWAVSTPAQVAGVAALSEPGFVERTRAYVAAGRARLVAGMRALGLGVVEGEANFLLVRSDRELFSPLLARGFLVRRCENFHGLAGGCGEGGARLAGGCGEAGAAAPGDGGGPWWYRVAVRTHEENEALLGALAEVLG
ncbi:MAG: histidinol-phosphate transaminase [Olsenella sp.]|nr:histidinol-phosphate transaminase [Olsenella sp.]